ncbi:MAG: hypothetical protein AB7F22_37405 [Reyranella sp.]|uniref:hypothetical protein n=1 Tax=Reyranella sp. TaxID=1929291 RepID=UPI003D0EA657
MSTDRAALDELWRIRNAAAMTLALSEEQMRRAVGEASVEELVALIETFAPGRSSGPEWTRTFEPLMERLWAWRDDETLAALARVFGARGLPWAGVARALSPEQGVASRATRRQPAWARLPAFTVV